MTFRDQLDAVLEAQRQRLEAERLRQDQIWQEWCETPEATMAILQDPRLGTPPSQRTYSGPELLRMIRDRNNKNG